MSSEHAIPATCIKDLNLNIVGAIEVVARETARRLARSLIAGRQSGLSRELD
jgi:hypothetical protein